MIAEEWLHSIDVTAKLHYWPAEYKLEVARANLSGKAKNWYLANQTCLSDWDKFDSLFKEIFMSQVGLAERWKHMTSRVQIKGETVFAFVHDKIKLCHGLGLSPAETKKMICVGLHSKALCNNLLSDPHTSIPLLLADIREFEEVMNERNSRFPTSKTSHMSKPSNFSHNKPSKQEVPIDKHASITEAPTGRRCYNCNGFGHINRECPKRKRPFKCTECGIGGHTKKYCKQSDQNTPAVSFINTTTAKYKYIAPIKINGCMEITYGLIDTGCDICLIKSSVAKKFNLSVNPTSKLLTVYGNTKSNVVCGITHAKLNIDSVTEEIELWVVSDGAQENDLIVGRSFTDKDNVTFVKTSNEVIFDYNLIFPFAKEDFCATKSTIALSSHMQVLKKNELSIIKAMVDEGK